MAQIIILHFLFQQRLFLVLGNHSLVPFNTFSLSLICIFKRLIVTASLQNGGDFWKFISKYNQYFSKCQMLLFNLDVIVSVGLCDVCVWCIASVLVRIEGILGCRWQHQKISKYFQFSGERLAESEFFFQPKTNCTSKHPSKFQFIKVSRLGKLTNKQTHRQTYELTDILWLQRTD